MKLLSWNINGFAQKKPANVSSQIEAVEDTHADLVCLQEVRAESLEAWTSALSRRYRQVETTESLLGERHNFLLMATNLDAARRRAKHFEVPFAELVLCLLVDIPELGSIEVTTTHVPNGSGHGWRKIEHLEGLYRYFARTHRREQARILCGDFNCPQREFPDGTLLSWAQLEEGKLRPDRGERWDAGERALMLGLKAFDLTDVYRDQEDYDRVETEEGSWVASNRGRKFRRRFDHVFASAHLRPWQFEYLHDLRERGLSDHSAVIARFGS